MSETTYAEFLNLLKEKNDLVEVIGSYIKLDRRGYNYWACCPFHHEKTPSFSVNAADKYYHCFGCGVSGDVISFVKEYENVDFRQAVEILAKRAGLEVPAMDNRSAEEAQKKKALKDRLLSLMKDAARFYLNNLWSGKAEEHLGYLTRRKVQPTTMKKFGLGASLDFQSLPKYLLEKGYTPEECVESGACGRSEEGRLFDSLGGRLIIPIINNLDEVIAFGGRMLFKTDRAKYKNTRDTLLFDKRKNLYNINLVKKEKRVASLPNLIMLEGYMDVISLYQAGFHNVVASMGTSLTKEQVRLCKRYSDTVLISYDGDSAGQSANLRGLKLLEDEGVNIRVVPLPDGLDPDDVIVKRGAEEYRNCLGAAMPLIDYRLLAAKRRFDLSNPYERREYVREALSVIKEAESESEREELLKRVSGEANVSYTALQRDLESSPQKQEAPPPPARTREDPDRVRTAERFVLAACLFGKDYAAQCNLFEFGFRDETLERLAEYIMEEREKGKVRPSGVFDVFGSENPELNEVLEKNNGDLEGEVAEKYFRDCVRLLKQREIKEQIAVCRAAGVEAVTLEERGEYLTRIKELTKKLSELRQEES